MWNYRGDTPLWVIVVLLVAAMAASVIFAGILDKYGSSLDPDTIRIWLGAGGLLLAIILLIVGIRKLFS